MGKIKRFETFVNEGAKFEYKGDKKAEDLARETVGDGKDPNHFFVTISSDYMYKDKEGDLVAYSENPENAPENIGDSLDSETKGPFATIEEAMAIADDIVLLDLSLNDTLKHVTIEDRKNGVVYEKYLIAEQKITFNQEIIDDTEDLLKRGN